MEMVSSLTSTTAHLKIHSIPFQKPAALRLAELEAQDGTRPFGAHGPKMFEKETLQKGFWHLLSKRWEFA
jgi:hypothetical protein